MTAVLRPADHRIILRNVSWETYENLLKGHEYLESPESLAFHGLTGADITRLLEESLKVKRPEWLSKLEEWISQQNWPK